MKGIKAVCSLRGNRFWDLVVSVPMLYNIFQDANGFVFWVGFRVIVSGYLIFFLNMYYFIATKS